MIRDNEHLLDEFNLYINDFGLTETSNGFTALAKLIQTLFLIVPGTYPNYKDLGIGIQNYKFEYLDDITLNEIKTKVIKQIDKYIPNGNIMQVYVEKLLDRATGKYNKLGVLINVADQGTDMKELILTFDQAEDKGNKVISKVYIS